MRHCLGSALFLSGDELGQVISVRTNLLSWLALFRLGATARGILPFLLGGVIAWSRGVSIDGSVLLLSSLAVFCIMLMTFLLNEYYDYATDIANEDYHRLSGGSRVLPLGLIPRRHAVITAYIFLAAAIVIGLALHFLFRTGPLTIPLGAAAIFTGYFYSAGPFRWSYRGLGEIAIAFTCGWLATVAGYYLQAGRLDAVATLASLPGAFSVFLVILINEIPDIKSDRLSGKNNLAVRLGREKTGVLYSILLIICGVNIIVNVFFGVPLMSAYLSIVLLPLIIWNILTISRKGLADRQVQEWLSIRTMVFDHLITVIYAVSFIVAGLNIMVLDVHRLVMLAAAFIGVFLLEVLGLACSKSVVAQ
jgi:1,4-dihydroxy-2-naphthoate octaprenyltransferase